MRILLLITGLIYSQITMAFPPVGAVGLSGGTVLYPTVKKAPYNQVTNLGSGAVLIETGNENMLVDGGMEASGVAAWTCPGGASQTCTKTTTAGEFSSGAQALKIALSAGNLSVTQNVNTTSGIQTQGVVGLLYRVPSTITDFQICTLVAALTQTCTTAANIINDNKYHPIEIPVTMTPGSQVGFVVQTTASYTANVFIDAAYVKQGFGYQALMQDTVYSAQVSAASVVSNSNKGSWITCSGASGAVKSCTFAAGIFTVQPNCQATGWDRGAGTNGRSMAITTSTTGILLYTIYDGVSYTNDIPFTLSCQKSGADYANASSAAYVSTNGNYGWTAYTPTIVGFGTPTALSFFHERVGDTLFIRGTFTSGTPTAVIGTIALPNSLVSANTVNENAGSVTVGIANTNMINVIRYPGTNTAITFGVQSGSVPGLTPILANQWATSGNVVSFTASIPITGWSNSNLIVGSFAGYTNVPGLSGGVDHFSVSYGTTNATTVCSASPCSYLDQIGNAVSSVTRQSTGQYTVTTSRTYSKLKCSTNSTTGTALSGFFPMQCSSCNSVSMTTIVAGNTVADTFGTLMCDGQW